LANTSLEQIVVLHDELNVVNWQVNEHSRDLGSFLADQLVDEFVEDGTNLILVVRVLWNDSWKDSVGSHDVLLVECQLLSLHLLLLLLLLLLLDLLHLNNLLLGGRLLRLLLLLVGHLLLLLHVLLITALEVHLLSHHATSLLMLVLSVLTLVVLTSSLGSVTLWLILEVSVLTLATRSYWSLLLHKERHALDEKLEVVLELFLVSKISPLCTL